MIVPCLRGAFHCLDNYIAGFLTQGGKDTAAVEPTDSIFTENLFPVNISRPKLAGGAVTSVRTTECGAYSVTGFSEIQPDSRVSPQAIIRYPAHIAHIYSALENQVFEQVADFIVGNSGNHRRAHSETSFQSAGDVVFTSTFPDPEIAGGADTHVAGVEAKHYFTKRKDIETALVGRFCLDCVHGTALLE